MKFNHRTPGGKLKRHFFEGPDYEFKTDAHLENPGSFHWPIWYFLFDYLREPEKLKQFSEELEKIVLGWITKLKQDSLYATYGGFTIELLAGHTLDISVARGIGIRFPPNYFKNTTLVTSIPELLKGARKGYPDAMLPYHFHHRRFSYNNLVRLCRKSKGDIKALANSLKITVKDLRYIIQEEGLLEDIQVIRKKNNKAPIRWDTKSIELGSYVMFVEMSQEFEGARIVVKPRTSKQSK